MRKYILVAMLLLSQGGNACGISAGDVRGFFELTLHKATSKRNYLGDYPTQWGGGIHYQHNHHFYIRGGINHLSNFDKGSPINDEAESWFNSIMITGGLLF